MKFNWINKGMNKVLNKESAPAYRLTPEWELYTSVVTTSLNNSFYEQAEERIERVRTLIGKCDPLFVAQLAAYARETMNLRSIPLVMAVELARIHQGDNLVKRVTARTVRRADEITELLACYQQANRRTGTKKLNRLSKQLQAGLQDAFNTFDAYQFAKYNRSAEVCLKDALFLVHPKAKDERQQEIFNGIVNDNLPVPYTWETELSALYIESGVINCVITKDLSRLGRNYLDCGLYLEVFFPEHNVRYIAVNDGVDTLNKSAMDITPFRNILNEMYAADISVKIKSAFRARFQQGKYMATSAPYGYIKDPADHNHLLIDDKVAHIVREIFDLALQGYGIPKIRKHINKQHILRPAAYAAERGETGFERYFEDNEENRYIWGENSIRNILRSPIYAGNLAGYKRISPSMKSRKRLSKLPEEWEVIPDTHEGIVTQEEFDTVQRLMTSRRREENAGGFKNIFAGIIKCADCGYALRATSVHRRKRPDIIDCVQYSCNNYARNGNGVCTAHNIEARDLFNAVLADINRFADMAVNDEKAVRAIEKRLTETDHSRAKALEKEQRKLNKRLAELDRLFSSLYEDKVMERITERNFEMMSGKYQKEQLEIEARLKEVSETLTESYEKSQGVRDFLSLIRNYQGIKELDATIINALIDKIIVSERETIADGTVRQEIKIYYKFIGFVGELHIIPTKRWAALKPKNCTVCGIEYVPNSGISKYCPECRERIRKVRGTEAKIRSRERNRQACIELSAKNDRLTSPSAKAVSSARATRIPLSMCTAM